MSSQGSLSNGQNTAVNNLPSVTNLPAVNNLPVPREFPVEVLTRIFGYLPGGQAWLGQRQPNANLMLQYCRGHRMTTRKLIEPPLPWKPSRREIQDARQAAERRRQDLQLWGGAQPLDYALISDMPKKPVDLVRPERKRVLVFDDLRSMASWFTTGPGRGELLDPAKYPNTSFSEDGTAWQSEVQIVRVTFIDDARYSLESQVGYDRLPFSIMEYAQEAFAALANAMSRLSLQRLHIIVPGPRFTIFRSVDDPGFWELTHIRGLSAFDVTGSIPGHLHNYLKHVCTSKGWLPTGMAYQESWTPEPSQLMPGTHAAGTLDWPAILATNRYSQAERQHAAISKRYKVIHNRHALQRNAARHHKRQKLQALRYAVAQLDAIQAPNNGPYTPETHNKYAAETHSLRNRRDLHMTDFTRDSALYGQMNTPPKAPAPRRAVAKRNLDRLQQTLIADQENLTAHLAGGVARFARAAMSAKMTEYRRALKKFRLARKERRAAKRGTDAAFLRDLRRQSEGDKEVEWNGVIYGDGETSGTARTGGVDEGGDAVGRLLGDVSGDESDVNDFGFDQRLL